MYPISANLAVCVAVGSQKESKNTYIPSQLFRRRLGKMHTCQSSHASGSAKEHAKGNKVLLHAAFKANQVTN